ncbi:MAG: hypothetical protein CMG62_10010 [Candidatus Marinimicrobia bacterium]|nr:hypothetical protein [Candidatus Neomarinimicrobiota bacterium]|tara:strand:+ start:1711 stop:2571 length:861 start_codon:yes stop_codon:yes gene_type:complete
MANKDSIIKNLDEMKIMSSKNTVIYSALTDSYDNILDPKTLPKNTDYILFTDDPTRINSKIWKTKKINFSYRDPRRLAKIFKILPHYFFPNYKYSIWVDSNIEIINDLNDLIKISFENNDEFIAFFHHPDRSCIYDEAKNIINLGYSRKKIVLDQINHYKKLNYPKNNGLIAGRFIIRKHNNKKCIELMKKWWEEIDNYSIRDQLSFNFSCWKKDMNYSTIDLNHFNNSYFAIHPHKKLKFYNQKGYYKISFNTIKASLYHYITKNRLYLKYLRKYYLYLKSILKM